MASQTYQPEMVDPTLNPLGRFMAQLAQYGQNASNNLSETITTMTLQGWLRVVIIVGGYALMRPYAIKFITKGAVKKMEDDDAREQAKAKITPNELRGAKQQLELQEEEDAIEPTAEASATDWGQRARLRQREILKQMMEAEEIRRQEEEDDKDIQEFLTE